MQHSKIIVEHEIYKYSDHNILSQGLNGVYEDIKNEKDIKESNENSKNNKLKIIIIILLFLLFIGVINDWVNSS